MTESAFIVCRLNTTYQLRIMGSINSIFDYNQMSQKRKQWKWRIIRLCTVWAQLCQSDRSWKMSTGIDKLKPELSYAVFKMTWCNLQIFKLGNPCKFEGGFSNRFTYFVHKDIAYKFRTLFLSQANFLGIRLELVNQDIPVWLFIF